MTERLNITINGPPAARLHRFLRFFPRKRVSFFYNSSFKFKRNGLAFWDFCPYLVKTRRISSFKYLYALHAYIRPSFSTFPHAGAVAKYNCPCGRDCKMSASVVRKISIVCLFVFFCNKVFHSVRRIIRLIIPKCSTCLGRPIYMILVLYASKTEHPMKTD